jgi:hypothetical protein
VAYTITVRAFNSNGESEPSAGLPVTTRRLLVRMSKVESTISGETGVRMRVYAPATAPNLAGLFIAETSSVTISAPAFDAIEGVNVCTVTGDISNAVAPTSTGGVPSSGGTSQLTLTAGASVLALLGKPSTGRWTGIEAATVVEEA